MVHNYTPTTEEVEENYYTGVWNGGVGSNRSDKGDFTRWLALVKVNVLEEVRDEIESARPDMTPSGFEGDLYRNGISQGLNTAIFRIDLMLDAENPYLRGIESRTK